MIFTAVHCLSFSVITSEISVIKQRGNVAKHALGYQFDVCVIS